MAFWKRHEVVKRNIELLSLQTVPFILATVYSDDEDGEFIYEMKNKYPRMVRPVFAENNPLGKKWQAGVNYAKAIGADPLITLGSDDFFNVDFVKNACELSKEIDFVGLTQWWAYDSTIQQLYKLRYIADFPLGGGRIYSEKLLFQMDWELFDSEKNHHLDDYAWTKKDKTWVLLDETTPYGLQILSVKGNWNTMNPLEKILNNPANILWSKINNIDKEMGFKVKELLTL